MEFLYQRSLILEPPAISEAQQLETGDCSYRDRCHGLAAIASSRAEGGADRPLRPRKEQALSHLTLPFLILIENLQHGVTFAH